MASTNTKRNAMKDGFLDYVGEGIGLCGISKTLDLFYEAHGQTGFVFFFQSFHGLMHWLKFGLSI